MKQKLTLKNVALILFLAPISVSRLFKSDPTFPPLEKIGRSVFIDSNNFYKWLSLKAGQTVTPADNLMKSIDLQAYYQKSHTWIWQNVKAGNLPKPFKINRSNYWLERDICGKMEEVA